MSSAIEEESLKQLDEIILISMNICRGVIQKYIAHTQSQDVEKIFPNGVAPVQVVQFQFQGGDNKFIKLDLINWKTYKFDLGRWNCKPIKEMMAATINNLSKVFSYVIANDIPPEILAELPNKELLINPFNIISDPNTNIFIFNPSEDKEKNLENLKNMHDKFPLRIGFTWASS